MTTSNNPANPYNAYVLYDTASAVYRKKLVTSLTRSGTTATAECIGHGFTDQQSTVLSGAGQADYNGTFTITVIDADHFSYTVSNSPVTPATGEIYAGDPEQSTTARACRALQVVTPAAGTTLKIEQRIHPDAAWIQVGSDITSATTAAVTTFTTPVNEVRVRRSAGSGAAKAFAQM